MESVDIKNADKLSLKKIAAMLNRKIQKSGNKIENDTIIKYMVKNICLLEKP